MTTKPIAPSPSRATDGPARRIRRARALPGGRAVVGALLVASSAVATFAAYLGATAEPTTAYLVATETIAPGTRFATVDAVREHVGSVTVELASPLDERAILVEDLELLVGRVLVAPLERGDLISRTAAVDDGGVASSSVLSFALPRTAAVDGGLRPGERIDVLATYGSGHGASTAFVARGVPLLRVTAPDGSPTGSSGELTMTVAVAELSDVQALAHALSTADVRVTRSTADDGDPWAMPDPYQAGADEDHDPQGVG